jgi:hypothetical protein
VRESIERVHAMFGSAGAYTRSNRRGLRRWWRRAQGLQ